MTTTPREVIKARIERVKELYFIRNYTIENVAAVLKWDPKTIWRDVQKIRNNLKDQIKIADAQKIITRVLRIRSKIIQKAWLTYDKAVRDNNLGIELKSLNDIDEIERKIIDDLIKLGYLGKSEDDVENRIYEEQRKRIMEVLEKTRQKRAKETKENQ